MFNSLEGQLMRNVLCLWFSFLMVWPKTRRCTKIALESSRSTCGSLLCSSESCASCTNAAWRWRLICRRPQQRSGRSPKMLLCLVIVADVEIHQFLQWGKPPKTDSRPPSLLDFTRRTTPVIPLCQTACVSLSLQLVPYVGEELVSVKTESCSSAVSQERTEVLEVCSCPSPCETHHQHLQLTPLRVKLFKMYIWMHMCNFQINSKSKNKILTFVL